MRLTTAAILLVASTIGVSGAPAKKELKSRVDALVAPYMRQHVFSGVILIAKGDEILLNQPYGNANYEFAVPNTTETRFAIASITKRFTGVILARLEGEKKLALSDPLSKYVADFPSADKITLTHLRTHYSGVRDPEKLRRTIRMNHSTDDVVALLKNEPLGSAPGEKYSYTTANYAILANVIEKVTGKSFAEVVRQYVYEPANMRDSGELTTTTVVPRLATGYMPDPFGNGLSVSGPEDMSWKAGGGSSYSTTGDLHRYLRAFYSGKLTPGVKPTDVMQSSKLFEKAVSRSSGSFPGANAFMMYFPDDEVTVVVMSNNYSPLAGSIAQDVAAICFDQPYKIASVPVPDKAASTAGIPGKYSIEGYPPFTISLRGARMIMAWNAARMTALQPVGTDEWFSPLDWATLKMERNADGTVSGGHLSAPWTDKPLKITRLQ